MPRSHSASFSGSSIIICMTVFIVKVQGIAGLSSQLGSLPFLGRNRWLLGAKAAICRQLPTVPVDQMR